jgi:hypothetical protein
MTLSIMILLFVITLFVLYKVRVDARIKRLTVKDRLLASVLKNPDDGPLYF